MNKWNNYPDQWEKIEDILWFWDDSLSTWKKWNSLLKELMDIHWEDIVLFLRHKWNTPRKVQRILELKNYNEKNI